MSVVVTSNSKTGLIESGWNVAWITLVGARKYGSACNWTTFVGDDLCICFAWHEPTLTLEPVDSYIKWISAVDADNGGDGADTILMFCLCWWIYNRFASGLGRQPTYHQTDSELAPSASQYAYILKAGFVGSQKPQIVLNFPQRDCLRTRQLSIL